MKNLEDETLFLSNDFIFYTLEGEGSLVGIPSVFMRLAMCNLTCRAWATPDNPSGCDSYSAWSVSNKMTFKEIYEKYKEELDRVINDEVILKITGGEPLLQQKQLLKFLKYITSLRKEKYSAIVVDFETNGTLVPSEEFNNYEWYTTYTVSPKLSNNGDPLSKRYNEEALRWHAQNEISTFKFVVNSESDIQEIIEKYSDMFYIMRHKIYLMPCCGSRQELIENSEKVAEWCKKYGFNFSSRLQLLIWDRALGV